jgi:sulfur carrier protein ThiS
MPAAVRHSGLPIASGLPILKFCAGEPSMVTVEFAASLRRHVECAPQSVAAGSLRAVLEAALQAAPALASYVFDDQRCIRKHVAVFVNQTPVQDRQHLEQTVQTGDRVLVIQALSGG